MLFYLTCDVQGSPVRGRDLIGERVLERPYGECNSEGFSPTAVCLFLDMSLPLFVKGQELREVGRQPRLGFRNNRLNLPIERRIVQISIRTMQKDD